MFSKINKIIFLFAFYIVHKNLIYAFVKFIILILFIILYIELNKKLVNMLNIFFAWKHGKKGVIW